MKEIYVEGFKVRMEKCGDGMLMLSFPELPGVVGQVEKEEDAKGEAGRLIGAHLRELALKRPLRQDGPIRKGEKKARV